VELGKSKGLLQWRGEYKGLGSSKGGLYGSAAAVKYGIPRGQSDRVPEVESARQKSDKSGEREIVGGCRVLINSRRALSIVRLIINGVWSYGEATRAGEGPPKKSKKLQHAGQKRAWI